MITIRNGDKTLKVSRGAFNQLYHYTGWKEVSQEDAEGVLKATEDRLGSELSETTSEEQDGLNEPSTASEEVTLEEMSDMELKQYAALLGINTKKLSDREQLIKAIKAHKK